VSGDEIILVSHSTRPRGGLVHTLHLAEALQRLGEPVRVVAVGDPAEGLFRPTTVPTTVVGAPPSGPTLEARVIAAVDALAGALSELAAGAGVLHAQDCIAARAAARVRDANEGMPPVVRTVHHVDAFTTPALVDCQRRAILEPDRVLVVSEHWRQQLLDDYGVLATVVSNGVDPARFPPVGIEEREALRARVGSQGRFLVLTVGGVEPRKGTVTLFEAMGELKRRLQPAPVLAVVGGHSFQDYRPYREAALARLPGLGLEIGGDVVLLGTVSEADLGGWYRAADAFAFPSLEEGFGLAPLEALAAGLPVVASDIPVFGEFLVDDESALLVPPGDSDALAGALHALAADPALQSRLAKAGAPVVERFTWEASALQHQAVYASLSVATGA
jgi:glycosyltransferase-like protein